VRHGRPLDEKEGELAARDARLMADTPRLMEVGRSILESARRTADKAPMIAAMRPQRRASDSPGLAERLLEAATIRAACEAVADHLAEWEGFMPSVYLEQGDRLRCQAVRGYWQIFDGMPATAGVIGHTFRTGETSFVPDVSRSGPYLEAVPGVRSEICVPLRAAGRVVGVLNLESQRPLHLEALEEMKAGARLLGERLTALGGVPEVSGPRRLARHAADLASLVDEAELERVTVDAARDVAGMDSAMIATDRGAGLLTVRHTAGPFAEAFRALEPAALAEMATWVAAGASCYTIGDPVGVGFMAHDPLRQAGAGAVVVLPLSGRGRSFGILVLADASLVTPRTDEVELLELLAAQTASCLQTAAALAELRDRASRDPLTGLGHHATFHAALAAARSRVPERRSPVVLMLDIDGFKAINDSRGHAAGDEMLREMTVALSGALRGQDHLFRLGGDEFAALIEVEEAEAALEVGNRLSQAARHEAGATVSIGVAVPGPEESDAALLARADRALYAVKREGGDGERLAEPPA